MKGQTESINFERDVIYFIFYISCFITFFPDVSVRSSHQRCTIEIDLLKISQNSQENTCARVFLIKLQIY